MCRSPSLWTESGEEEEISNEIDLITLYIDRIVTGLKTHDREPYISCFLESVIRGNMNEETSTLLLACSPLSLFDAF